MNKILIIDDDRELCALIKRSVQKFDLIRKSILSILQTKNAYDIMPVGKMIRLNSFITQQKPQSCDL